EQGAIDMIVNRAELRTRLANLLSAFTHSPIPVSA
ncbi:acetyl-CoA carboxylase carboxyl transferase subunit beta, partial [Pseudomonas aeruginosa]